MRVLHPFWMLRHLSNNVHALAAAELGARGAAPCSAARTPARRRWPPRRRALDDGRDRRRARRRLRLAARARDAASSRRAGLRRRSAADRFAAPYDVDPPASSPARRPRRSCSSARARRQRPRARARGAIDRRWPRARRADGSATLAAAHRAGAAARRATGSPLLLDGAAPGQRARSTAAERAAVANAAGPTRRWARVVAAMGQLGAATARADRRAGALLAPGRRPDCRACDQPRPDRSGHSRARAVAPDPAVDGGPRHRDRAAPGLVGAVRVEVP